MYSYLSVDLSSMTQGHHHARPEALVTNCGTTKVKSSPKVKVSVLRAASKRSGLQECLEILIEGQPFLLGYFKLDAIFLKPSFAIFKKKINVVNFHTTRLKERLLVYDSETIVGS